MQRPMMKCLEKLVQAPINLLGRCYGEIARPAPDQEITKPNVNLIDQYSCMDPIMALSCPKHRVMGLTVRQQSRYLSETIVFLLPREVHRVAKKLTGGSLIMPPQIRSVLVSRDVELV
ncbi:hypothetical protein KL911_001415 [Ogataea haglerorum]|uniref:uncharacterized protein n=1 Tax=Ogataea haglerorum TaxID=1937702 RepID=UPI001C89054D|nr:uncharacterized protein KL911_001415 [Ogataea haglerorum]KAG7756613.1 hypothetical protein KL911_001415 [Ogataea haglerorum]